MVPAALAVSLCLPGHILSGAWSPGVPEKGLLFCWAPITEHPVPTSRQRSLQLRIFLRKQSGPQPQDLCACFTSCSGYLASRPRLLLFLFAYETLLGSPGWP